MQHSQFDQFPVAGQRGLHRHLLNADAHPAARRAGQGQRPHPGRADTIPIDVAGKLDRAAVGQVGDQARVFDVEMPPIGTPRLKCFDDVGGMLLGTTFRRHRL